MGRIWMKLYVGWHESDWLSVLAAESRLCWILLLERVKTHGDGGSLKKSNYDDLARRWNVGVENIRTMVKAAVRDGAIDEDETHWHVSGWSEYQEDRTNADRQKRYRERQKESGKTLQSVTDNALRQKSYRDRKKRNESGSDNGALRNDRNVTTRGEERRIEEIPPKSPKGDVTDFGGVPCPEVLRPDALRWQKFRREIKHPVTPSSWEVLFAKHEQSPTFFQEAVEFTIEMGWRGLKHPSQTDVKTSLTPGSARKHASEVHLAN